MIHLEEERKTIWEEIVRLLPRATIQRSQFLSTLISPWSSWIPVPENLLCFNSISLKTSLTYSCSHCSVTVFHAAAIERKKLSKKRTNASSNPSSTKFLTATYFWQLPFCLYSSFSGTAYFLLQSGSSNPHWWMQSKTWFIEERNLWLDVDVFLNLPQLFKHMSFNQKWIIASLLEKQTWTYLVLGLYSKSDQICSGKKKKLLLS